MIPSLTIIIPTLTNTTGLKYLLSYFKKTVYPVIIIDNQPTREKEKLIKITKKFFYLKQRKNLGFSASVNQGAKKTKSRWLLILNDDVEFKVGERPIEKLLNFAQEKKLDAVSPVLVNPQGAVENVGYQVLPYGKIKLVKKLTSLQVNELDGLTAACLLVKTSVFKKLGGFDENFFAYLEDVEFFLRFKKSGYKMGIAPQIKVIHQQMTTSKTMGNFKNYQDMINWWRLYFKHKDKFKFNLAFILERLRNIAGFIKYLINLNH